MNKLIFGKDNTQGIVNISCVDGLAYIYKLVDGAIECEVVDHTPYALTNEQYETSSRLRGNKYYKYKTPILDQKYEEVRGRGIYKPRSKEEGYMLSSGATYFKGLKPNQLSILSFDIETTTLDPLDPLANVVLISSTFRDRNGVTEKSLLDINTFSSAEKMIEAWCSMVQDLDPDILIGHNIFGFDLDYMSTFAPLKLGRDGSEIKFDTKVSKKRKDGSQSYDYYNCRIHGREIIDTMFLSITYDVGRNFPSYGLKRIERYLGLVDDSRIEWDFDKNPVREVVAMGGKTWEDFCDYCRDDADSPIAMFDIMAPSLFYLNQSIPKTFQQMVNEATGSQIDSFMIRAYLQDGWSQPKTSQKKDFEGAISMGIPGVYEHVRKVDVASLYPSIMMQYEIYPTDKDKERYFLKSLQYFRDERLKNKALAKDTGDKYYDDLQNAQKIMINSMYGFMGANYLLYNDPAKANEVTKHGREILQKGVEWATGFRLKKVVKKIKNKGKPNEEIQYHWVPDEKLKEGRGYQLVNVDTDSFSVTNGQAPTKEEFDKEITDLNSIYPELIRWEDDGVFDKVVVVKAKNYVLVKGDKIKYKGSSLTDQKKEPILIQFLHDLINIMLNEDALHGDACYTYNDYCHAAIKIEDINEWAMKKTVTKLVLKPKRKQEQKVLDAIRGEGYREGDKVWLYAAEGDKLKLLKYYDNDADKWHYVKRVYNTLKILEELIDIKEFPKYFNKTKQYLLEETCKPTKDVV